MLKSQINFKKKLVILKLFILKILLKYPSKTLTLSLQNLKTPIFNLHFTEVLIMKIINNLFHQDNKIVK